MVCYITKWIGNKRKNEKKRKESMQNTQTAAEQSIPIIAFTKPKFVAYTIFKWYCSFLGSEMPKTKSISFTYLF